MILRRLFGRGGDEPPPPQIENAWDLKAGDFLKMALAAPEGLSAAEMQVTAVHALDFGGPTKTRRVLDLEGGGAGPTQLWRDERDRVAVARTLERGHVERLFDLAVFATLFDAEATANVVLERREEPGELSGWTAPLYRQEGAEQAWYHPQDPATASIDDHVTGDAEGIDHYRLVSDDRRHAIEVQVFDSGRTDVLAVALLTAGSVEELWPAGG